jgi:hypothetical protein
MFTIEKDDFTGLKKINSAFYGLKAFMSFDGPSSVAYRYMIEKTGVSDVFDLLYVETENGQGNLVIRICSTIDRAKYSVSSLNSEWPHWNDEWPMIIDGERLSLSSTSTNSFETDYELKVYNLPIDIFAKICNANEVKFSLRGRNNKIEGAFIAQHITLFKAFEQYCFGDENEGKKLLESIGSFVSSSNSSNNQSQGDTTTYSCYSCKANNIVPNSWESFSCNSCKKDNSIIKPKELTDEERNKHESKVVDLIKDKKIDDAIKYYATNFGYTEDSSKLKVKELAEKNGMASIYKKHETKNALIGFVIIAVVIFVLFKACS